MKKIALIMGALLLTASMVVVAQTVNDDFSSMRGWTAGAGDWVVRGGRLVQQNAQEPLARIDRRVNQGSPYELEFAIRYVDGGFRNQADFENGIYHAGFGIHLGVENPALGRKAWGSGNSYLLWLNLDTRPETRRNRPEHYGFRAQLYRSTDNSTMSLARDPALRRDPELSRYVVDDYMSIDIIRALRDWGVNASVHDLAMALDLDVPINIRVNPRTGEIGVLDPTAPIRFFFQVDPAVLRGDYVSLRTNKLAASFPYFTVD
ncbi:MAG: hypothetical protein EA427_09095 [Spirochaetaceae bacterium]|nr:MAG: hypothetical protein EA427_09095 [Spirochaetaceae bacterium]